MKGERRSWPEGCKARQHLVGRWIRAGMFRMYGCSFGAPRTASWSRRSPPHTGGRRPIRSGRRPTRRRCWGRSVVVVDSFFDVKIVVVIGVEVVVRVVVTSRFDRLKLQFDADISEL